MGIRAKREPRSSFQGKEICEPGHTSNSQLRTDNSQLQLKAPGDLLRHCALTLALQGEKKN
jgi:hypothetical protein